MERHRSQSLSRRVAVSRLRPKGRFPLGVVVVLLAVASIGGLFYLSSKPNPEIQQLRDELRGISSEAKDAVTRGDQALNVIAETQRKHTAKLDEFVQRGVKWQDCDECQGNGYIKIRSASKSGSGYVENHFECMACDGAGIVQKVLCRTCLNLGVVLAKNYDGGMERGLRYVTCPECDGEFRDSTIPPLTPRNLKGQELCTECMGKGTTEVQAGKSGVECKKCGGRGFFED